MTRLYKLYKDKIILDLMKKFLYKNINEVPKLNKIIINIGVGEASQNNKVLDFAINDLKLITGQQPIMTNAKKSIAIFKLREGMPIGCKVTLRSSRMYEFLDRLANASLPRVRDFKGIPNKGFDKRGNYTLGINEHLIFPEIDFDKIDKVRGMNITFVTTAKSDKEAKELLKLLGIPFANS